MAHASTYGASLTITKKVLEFDTPVINNNNNNNNASTYKAP